MAAFAPPRSCPSFSLFRASSPLFSPLFSARCSLLPYATAPRPRRRVHLRRGVARCVAQSTAVQSPLEWPQVAGARVHVHRLGCSAARLAWVSVLCAASRACRAVIGALTRVVGVFAPLSLSCVGSRPVDAPKAAVLSVRRAARDFPPDLATPADEAGGSFVGALAGRAWVTCTGSGLFVRFVFYGHHPPRFPDPPACAWPARSHLPRCCSTHRRPPSLVSCAPLALWLCARPRAPVALGGGGVRQLRRPAHAAVVSSLLSCLRPLFSFFSLLSLLLSFLPSFLPSFCYFFFLLRLLLLLCSFPSS